MAQRRFFIAIRHPLASAASSTQPQIFLRGKTLRNKKHWGNQLQGQTPTAERGIINAAQDSRGGRNPEENKNLGATSSKEKHPLVSATSMTPPQITLGDKKQRNKEELPLGDETPGTKEELPLGE